MDLEQRTVVLFILPPDRNLAFHKLNQVTSHVEALARTVLQICSQPPNLPLSTVREWDTRIKDDKPGTILIDLPNSTDDEVAAVKAAAETARDLLSPMLDVQADEITIEINPGAEAPEAHPGPCVLPHDCFIPKEFWGGPPDDLAFI